jgi:hypothetical protein
MSPAPLRPLETPQTERIRDLVTRIGHLTPWQLRELVMIMAGRDPDLIESTLRVIPRADRETGQIIPWPADSGRPL